MLFADGGTSGTPSIVMALDLDNDACLYLEEGALTLGYFYMPGQAVSSGSFYGAPGTSLGFMVSQDFTPSSSIVGDNVGFSWFNGYNGGRYTVAGTYSASGTTTISLTTADFTGSVSLGTALNVSGHGRLQPCHPRDLDHGPMHRLRHADRHR